MMQSSNSSLVQVPLSSTPLRLNPEPSWMNADSCYALTVTPSHSNLSETFQEDNVTLGRRANRLDYALFNRTGEKREARGRRK